MRSRDNTHRRDSGRRNFSQVRAISSQPVTDCGRVDSLCDFSPEIHTALELHRDIRSAIYQFAGNMSGRRLMSCTSCKQRHYAPSGARCPYIPPKNRPESDVDDQQQLSDSDLMSEEDTEGTRAGTAPYSASEFELPSGQRDQQPSTSTAQQATPLTLQEFADATSNRVQQLEEERNSMLQTQETLVAQQRQLEAQLAAIRQQWTPGPLQPNQDITACLSSSHPGQRLHTSHQQSANTEPT